jgi:tRNA modification GTPase
MLLDQSTICAISTPPGIGGIAVIRLSGKDAVAIADQLYVAPDFTRKLKDQRPGTLHFGSIHQDGILIDEVIISLFKSPHSYTGEDVVEISCHGSLFVQQQILQALLSKGARLAKPGEFTQRAFYNGKMDLSQAEAVADLIASTNAASHRLALNQMRGGFSHEINHLREELIRFIALIELELDFSEEDVEFADRSALIELSFTIENLLKKLTDSFKLGNAIKNGIPVAIVGETNVGKSTLLNALLNEEKAIVSEIHGTTRDVIEDLVNLEGILFRLSDTAGLRETSDLIETMGIERTYGKMEKAEIVLLVVDITERIETIIQRIQSIREKMASQKLIIVGNKLDCSSPAQMNILSSFPLKQNEELVLLSAKNKDNITELIEKMKQSVSWGLLQSEDVVVTNVRHYEALKLARQAITRVIEGLKTGISGDFLSQDIRECLHYLGEITGQVTNDEVLGHIFKNFCIGK